MIQIFLIRHGQTDWNIQRRLQGHTDIPLNEKGRAQSRALKNVLAPLEIDAFMTSDLSRAIETAEIARAHPEIPLIQNSGLRETSLGEAEGLFFDELHLRFPDAYKRLLTVDNENQDYAFPGGETKLQHRERLEKTLHELMSTHSFRRIGMVTHGGAIRRFLELSKNFTEKEFRTNNTCVYELNYLKDTKDLIFVKRIYNPD